MTTVRRILFGRDPRRTAVRLVVLAVVATITFGWVLIPIRTEGISMLPTYESGRLHLVNRFAYSSGSPARGDVIAIMLAGPHVAYVKRVVALPGERIAVVGGEVRINGVALAEPYVHHQKIWNFDEVQLGNDEYFVIGDNRIATDYGAVNRERILGKVVF